MLSLLNLTIVLSVLLTGCRGIDHPAANWSGEALSQTRTAPLVQSAWTARRAIPDGDRRGLVLGPVFTGKESGRLGSVTLRLDLSHPATVDLRVRLGYDTDGDGRPDLWAPVEFYRSRPGLEADELHASPYALEGSYFFRDGDGPDEAAFTAFRGAPRGHAFYLAVADTLAGETGDLLGWSIYLEKPQSMASK